MSPEKPRIVVAGLFVAELPSPRDGETGPAVVARRLVNVGVETERGGEILGHIHFRAGRDARQIAGGRAPTATKSRRTSRAPRCGNI